MKRLLTLLTLCLWAGLLLWFWFSGRVAAYLHPQFHAYVAIAGAVLLVLAPLWWWASRDGSAGCESCDCDSGHGSEGPSHDAPRGLGAGAVFAFVVLILPVSAAAVISPSQFGEAAVMNRGIVTDISLLPTAQSRFAETWQDAPLLGDEELPDIHDWPEDFEEGVEFFTRGPDGAIELETIDLLFAADEPGLRDEFDNQRVAIVGQYVPPRGAAGGFDLVRMFVVCCAADARPLGIKVVAAEEVEVPRMGWVRITGVARFAPRGGRFEPSLELEKIEEVPAPRETFLY